MKILLTGGGTGGHFYPIIAVAQSLRKLTKEHRLIDVKLYYMAPQPYDKNLLFDNQILFIQNPAGKLRRYFSLLSIIDFFQTGWGILTATWALYWIYPDVVFSKGGYVSFPVLCAARFLRIPVVIHESDSVPGRVNLWAGKFADRVAVSYPQAAEFFKKEKVAYTGNPIRQELTHPVREGAHEFLKLENEVPVLLVLGGSQGAQIVNDAIIEALPRLVEKYQVIHQTGKNNLKLMVGMAKVVLHKSQYASRYRPFDTLNTLALRMSAGAANLVISRAGSTIFEIAAWAVPAILIPITDSNGDHQRQNAYGYAHAGGAVIIEEANLSANIIISEIDRILTSPEIIQKMIAGAKSFARTDAADLIAEQILEIGVKHEK